MPRRLDVDGRPYGLVTLHRPSNVDSPETFERLVEGLATVASDVPLLFPVHPRTRPMLERSLRLRTLVDSGRLRILDALGYLEFLGLMSDATIVLTDSGGIQEETTVLGVPCLTLRAETERPITVSEGTNVVVGLDADLILAESRSILRGSGKRGRIPALWDGRAAERIVAVLAPAAS